MHNNRTTEVLLARRALASKRDAGAVGASDSWP